MDNTRIATTNIEAKNGQTKCPRCGSTDLSTNAKTGMLRCNYCRHEFVPPKVTGLTEDLSKLEGRVVSSGAQDIVASTDEVLTFKCSSCGAEVVIDTASAQQARCHWCRNTLSVNEQMPNGAVPDAVLPFLVTKEDAKRRIEEFVGARKFFAHPQFKKEFTTENVMGVYFPYMVIDVNAHVKLDGQGEKLVRQYSRKVGDHYKTYYDADRYDVGREFDLVIDGLTVEGNSMRRKEQKGQTNNIINAIMPFDTENCVQYNANFLKGYTSERRDSNVAELTELVKVQAKDVARHAANDSLKFYNRGVCWSSEEMQAKGSQWQAAYLPVWLYSYQQKNNGVLHYVAVNARTKEVMGSVPIFMPKLLAVSIMIEAFTVAAILWIGDNRLWFFALSGIIYYIIFHERYRNKDARHTHELETQTTVTNMKQRDTFIKRLTGLSNSKISGMNNTKVECQGAAREALNNLTSENNAIINALTDGNPLADIVKKNIKK